MSRIKTQNKRRRKRECRAATAHLIRGFHDLFYPAALPLWYEQWRDPVYADYDF